MGKIKKLIPLFTIQIAAVIMLISPYVIPLVVGRADFRLLINSIVGNYFTYTYKYIVALILMYLIMRDKKSIVLGCIGLVYVLISGICLFSYFWNYFDFEVSLLEDFFFYIDPLIIYIAFTTVFICFIGQKGNKYFLFALVGTVTLADMIVGTVYYADYFLASVNTYAGEFNTVERFLLEVFNSELYFHWFVDCFVFISETLLIIIFEIIGHKKELKEEEEVTKEKEDGFKLPAFFIPLGISILLSFIVIFVVFKPISNDLNPKNAKDSVLFKTLNRIPAALDDSAKVSTKQILSECPFETTEDTEWVFYPKDNLAGLVAMKNEYTYNENSVVLVFRYLKSARYINNTITQNEFIGGRARYGGFSFNSCEIIEKKHFIYVKVDYDNRIVGFKTISFDKNEDRLNIDLSDDNIELVYCNFGDKIIIRKYQTYDAAKGTWEEIIKEEEEREPETSIPYVQWTELQVVDGANSYEGDNGLRICVSQYDYKYNYYNIYGEINNPQETKLTIYIFCNDKLSDEIISGIYNVKLYSKNKDITPEDFTVETNYSEENTVAYTLKSNALGELTEGDYTLEYAGYNVDFELKVQTFEAW